MNIFNKTCIAIWGEADWKPIAADTLDVTLRNVQYWAAGTKAVPPGVMTELLGVLREAKTEAARDYQRLEAAEKELINTNTVPLSAL
jgi:hypothetical protein